MIPTKVSRQKAKRMNLDLLLLSNDRDYHFVLIKNLRNLANKIKRKRYRAQDRICRNCFHISSSREIAERHELSCYRQEPAVVRMPPEEKSSFKFRNLKARWFLPIVVYYDLESILRPVEPTEARSTQILEQHEPCGFALVAVEHGRNQPLEFVLQRDKSCIQTLLRTLERIAREVHQKKRRHKFFLGTPPVPRESATRCWICEEMFEDDTKVLDHCHYSGKFLGWSHQRCNINRSVTNFIPVIAHNASNYDLHHICKQLHAIDPQHLVSVIPSTDEKYIALDVAIFIRSYVDTNGRTQKVYEHLRFIDSLRFLLCSLDKLAATLTKEDFGLIDDHFRDFTEEERQLIKQKGFYPYSYVDSEDKFSETQLPPRSEWRNSLNSGEISISEQELQHANLVFKTFKCKTLGDYHDVYLTTDVLILAAVFEAFRKVCYEAYGLDCACYFSASNLSGDSFLKMCKADIQLLTEREHLEMSENLIRGGMSGVSSERLFEANNPLLPNFDPTKPITFGVFLDSNSLYGGIMLRCFLPLKNFSMDTQVSLDQILQTPEDSQFGYILEVDINYPEYLHDEHEDFPLAPNKQTIDEVLLSEYQISLLQSMNAKYNSTAPKLVQNVFDKKNYTVHYETLKLYTELGMKVTKVHRVLKFEQSRFMSPYVALNTELRQNATDKIGQLFFKLMINSLFGKMCESKRNRCSVKLVRTENAALTCVEKANVKTFKIFDENLAAVTMRPSVINWNKPTIIGAVILDLAKRFMFQFHYKVMKNRFNCKVLYHDTDSLFYKIQTEDLYEDLKIVQDELACFDFSNYDPSHPLYDVSNRLVALKFKDELPNDIVKEFCGLKSKMYSILTTCKSTETIKYPSP